MKCSCLVQGAMPTNNNLLGRTKKRHKKLFTIAGLRDEI
jgi:hypothetical protein